MKTKTKKTIPAEIPEQPLVKDATDPQMLVEAMRRLLRNDDFKLLRRFWAGERISIIETVKRKRDPIECAVLDGFDRAIIVPEIWAHKQTGDDIMRKRHADLMSELNMEKVK